MRCRGCDKMLTGGNANATNKHTGEFEDICSDCRDPSNDNGIVYKMGSMIYRGSVVDCFYNEAEYEKEYIGGTWSGMSSADDIIKAIKIEGMVKTEETN